MLLLGPARIGTVNEFLLMILDVLYHDFRPLMAHRHPLILAHLFGLVYSFAIDQVLPAVSEANIRFTFYADNEVCIDLRVRAGVCARDRLG